MNLICFGDSLTFGYGVKKEECWVNLLESKLKIQVINKGINGDTTAGMLSRSYKDVILPSPTQVIIMGGTNDFLSGREAKYVYQNVCLLAEEFISHNINPVIAIQPPIAEEKARIYWSQAINYTEVNKKIYTYRESILKHAKVNHMDIIDFYSAFMKESERNFNTLFIDGIHPTKDGHNIMSQIIATLLK